MFLLKLDYLPSRIFFFPQLKHVIEWASVTMRKESKTIERTLIKIVNEHNETIDASNPRDIIDELLLSAQEYNFDYKTIVHAVSDLMIGGSDSTSITLLFFIANMINHPDIATRVQNELDEKIGKNSIITIEKCQDCPYFNACIQETLRLFHVAPLSGPHFTTQPTKIGSYIIPANVIVIPFIQAIHQNPKIWGPNADVFCPERFLQEGESQKELVTFGLGLRRCPGEELAKIELMLNGANLMLNFSWKSPERDGKMEIDGVLGLVLNPVYTKVIVSERP